MRPEDAEAYIQGFEHAQKLMQQQAAEQPVMHMVTGQTSNQEKRRLFPFARTALVAVAVSTAAFALLDGVFEVESVTEGSATTLLDARSIEAVTIWTGQKIVTGSADHEVLGPTTNPWASATAIVERDVEYMPTGAVELRAVQDEDIGFYLFITETKNNRDIPFDFTNIRVSTPKPEPCPIEIVDNEIRPKDYCTPITDPSSRGLFSSYAWQGAPFQNDTSITRDARTALDVAKNNTYCEVGVVFDNEALRYALQNQVKAVSNEAVYEGVTAAVKAVFRTQLSKQYNIPLTNSQGLPLILWEDDIRLLKRLAEQQKKPITQFSVEELRQSLQLTTALDEPQGAIDPGPLFVTEILAAQKNNNDINLPSSTPDMTEEGALYNGWNYSCLPDGETDQANLLLTNQERSLRIGNLGYLPAYANVNGDGSFMSPQNGETLIAQLKTYVGITNE